MLRLIVLVLLLANAGYYAWSHGFLLAWGLGPAHQSEPQRLQQQIRPESVRILRPEELRQIEAQVAQGPRPAECLRSPMLAEAQLATLRSTLASWPPGSWSIEPATEPARWIVYMGPYGGVEQVARKRAELRQIGVSFEPPASPQLQPGLSLGGFPSEAGAQQQLARLTSLGVRTARVLQERPEVHGERLTLPGVDDTLRPRLDELKTVLGTNPLRPCR